MTNNLDLNPVEDYVGLKRFHEHWVSFLILGIILIFLGALAIIGSNVATLTSIIFFGILLTIGGILQIIYSFWERKGHGFAQTILSGIFYTVVGILMLTHPTVSALAITLLLAAFYTVNGVFKIIISLTTPIIQWGWLLFSGIVSLALGILIWTEWPYSAHWLIGLFIGIDLLFVGWFWIMLSLAVKDLPIKTKLH
jgi:uncharacterized membrane protein HdeD (DUF308 family)